MKKKNEDNRSNEYWLNDILDQPENKHEQPDGSTLYGYDDEPKFGSQGYWLNIKNGLVHVWQAKNPFNENRKVMKEFLPLTHPDMYKFFFPFSYIGHFFRNVFSGNIELRRQTLEDSVLVTLIVEMLVMFVSTNVIVALMCAITSCKPDPRQQLEERMQTLAATAELGTVEYTVKKIVKTNDKQWFTIGDPNHYAILRRTIPANPRRYVAAEK